MKKILLVCFLSLSLFGLTKGERLGDKSIQTLKLKQGTVYVVDFFASWCRSCKKELPLITKLNNNIDKTKFEIIGVDVDKDKKVGVRFQKQMGVNFRVINDHENILIKAFAPVGIPALYFIKNGVIMDEILGAVHDIDKVITRKLKEIR